MAKKVVKTDTEKVAKLARPGKYVYYFGDGKADGDMPRMAVQREDGL